MSDEGNVAEGELSEVELARAQLAEENPEALWADGFDAAFVGIGRRCGQPALAVFSESKAIDVLIAQGMTHDEAVDYFHFNVSGAWMGPGTPLWLSDYGDDE